MVSQQKLHGKVAAEISLDKQGSELWRETEGAKGTGGWVPGLRTALIVLLDLAPASGRFLSWLFLPISPPSCAWSISLSIIFLLPFAQPIHNGN